VAINRRTPPHKNAVVDGRKSEMTITGNAREYAYEMERLAKQIAAERDALKAENARLREALKKINIKDSYSKGSYGPFAEIARAELGETQ